MELVVKITDDMWKAVQDGWVGNELWHNALANGTPLPKGHGRLIDADAMQKYQIDTFGKRLLVIDTAPTIIEADKLPNNELENPFNDSRFGG